MKCWIILAASFCAIYQCVDAGNGYVYNPPAKRTELEQPIGNQNDFDINEFITSQKESIFASIAPKKENQCAECSCGVQNANRIVGGTQVRTNKYPWIAQLLMGAKKRLFCGGALINDRYIVTAGHCIHKMNWQSMSVRVLQHDRNSASTPGITRKVVKAIVHESYNPTTIVNDIALLKLDSPIPLTDQMRPVCLPSPRQNFDLKQAVVAGWGLTKEYGSVSSTLQEVLVPILTNAQCRATQYKTMITENMLCAGDVAKGGKDACQGDSGGPLIVLERVFRLAGVVSFGYGCAKPNAPGVYTRVSNYLPWIIKNTADGCYCKH